MAKNPHVVIDIGNRYIKILEVSGVTKDGLKIGKVGIEELKMEPGADQASFYQQIQDILPLVLNKMGLKPKNAIVTLPGRFAFTRRLEIPIVRGRQLDRIVKYEAKQHVPFPLEEINMDYQVSAPVEGEHELEVHLVAVRKENADAFAGILKKCGIRADIIEAAPLSVYNAYAATSLRDEDEVTAIVSVGASSTDIVIEQKGAMQFMRSAPMAGNQLSSMISTKLDIPIDKAEELKKKPSSDYTDADGVKAEAVAEVLESGFESIVTEVRRSFDFYVSQPDAEPVTRVLLCGSTVKMEGVAEFLEDRLGVPVSLLDVSQIEGVELPAEYKEQLRYEAPLIGMAVRAAGKAYCAMSFAPDGIKASLEFEKRAPMLGVAAALLVAMLGGSFFMLNTLVSNQAQARDIVQEIVSPGERSQPELREERETQVKYNNRYERIYQVAERRGTLSRVYLEVQNLIPQDVWLDTMDVRSDRLTLVGRALNDTQIQTYINNLTLSPFFDFDSVVLAAANVTTEGGASDQTQIAFTIDVVGYNNPTPAEIEFIETLRSLMTDTPILVAKLLRPESGGGGGFGGMGGGMGMGGAAAPAGGGGGYMGSDVRVLVGVYQMTSPDEKLNLYQKIHSAMPDTMRTDIQTVEVRYHDRTSNEVERIEIPIDSMDRFIQGSLGAEDFVQNLVQVTPSPSPTQTPTPTPEGEGGGGGGMGYGYGMGMYGGFGGGMYGGMPGGQ